MSYKDILFHCDEILELKPSKEIRSNVNLIQQVAKELRDEIKTLEERIDDLEDISAGDQSEISSLEEQLNEYKNEEFDKIHSTGIEYQCTEFLDIELMDTINELFFNGFTHRQIIDNITKTQ